jgi:hypothetical protein
VHGTVVEQRQDGAADVAAPDAMAPAATSAAASHLVPPKSMAASLSVHLSLSFRSIMN